MKKREEKDRIRGPGIFVTSMGYCQCNLCGQNFTLARKTKGGSITVQLTSCLTGLESAV
jgi:hypothetical protein